MSFSIFQKDYWLGAVHPKKKLLMLTMLALMVALNIAISAFFIPVGENLKIFASFIPTSIACLAGGPVMALCYGFVVDILGFLIHPSGAFFPGYVLSSMLGALLYSLFLYRQRITVLRIFLCKLCINVFVNICLGSLWSAILFGKGYYYYLAKSVIKNLALLPFEVLILVVIFKALLPMLQKMELISNAPKKIKFW